MGFVSARLGRVLLVRWHKATEGDVLAFVATLRGTHAGLGRAPILATILPESLSPPSPAARELMAARINELMRHVHCAYVIIEGSSLRSIAHRLVVTGLFGLSGQGDRVRICRSLDEFISLAGAEIETTRAEVHTVAARFRSSEWPLLSDLPV